MKKKSNEKFNNVHIKNNKAGVTLISLAVTIVVIMILSTATISTVFDKNGVLKKSKQTEDMSANTVEYEDIQLDKTMNKYANMIDETTKEVVKVLKDGSWDGTVNSPKIDGTGLIPVYYNETTGAHIELTENSTQIEWDGWYDYNTTNPKWANAITKDENGNVTGYFVWIPRYAYKIESGLHQDSTELSDVGGAGTISIKFLKDRTNYDSAGTKISTKYPKIDKENHAMTDYVLHPAFGTDLNNGGWTIDLPGFWVAKYPAGFQQNTITDSNGTLSTDISNSSDEVVRSNKKYTSYDTSSTTNAVGDTLSSLPNMSYPVFKPLTYVYNNITIGDSYTLSRQISVATTFYGLRNIDSHQMKNSEWGAVAYLTHSRYGRNKVELYINNYYTNTSTLFKTAITGVYEGITDSKTGVNNATTTAITDMKTYYSLAGVNGSSTGNIYGIYDLNGCVWERVLAYVNNRFITTTTTDPYKYGQSLITESRLKYKTVYNVGAIDSKANNYIANSSKYGDAAYEVSSNGENNPAGWNADNLQYTGTSNPFFVRGGILGKGESSGIFALHFITGSAFYHDNGFRVCLAF